CLYLAKCHSCRTDAIYCVPAVACAKSLFTRIFLPQSPPLLHYLWERGLGGEVMPFLSGPSLVLCVSVVKCFALHFFSRRPERLKINHAIPTTTPTKATMTTSTTTHHARYLLAADGTIRQWLACGTVAPRLDGLETLLPTSGDPHGHRRRWVMNYWAYHPEVILFKKRVHAAIAPFAWQPETKPVVDGPAMGGQTWRAAAAGEDRMLDFSRFNFVPSLMQGWAYTIIAVERRVQVPVVIFTIGPA